MFFDKFKFISTRGISVCFCEKFFNKMKKDLQDYYPPYLGAGGGALLYLFVRYIILNYEPVWWLKTLIYIIGFALTVSLWNSYVKKTINKNDK